MVKRLLTKTLHDVAQHLLNPSTSKVVVLAGAGISTPSGLPDFRSADSGLYDTVRERFDLRYPELIFDIQYFRRNPEAFFQIARRLYPGEYAPNAAHWFIRLLQDKAKLLRCYTQNIDGLETLAGITPSHLVEAHGSFAGATCMGCREAYSADDIRPDIFAGKVPHCPKCQFVIKPNVVFFGEMLPKGFLKHVVDLPRADLLLVMGTSLEVQPFASLVDLSPSQTPRLLINKQIVGPFADCPQENDVVLKGDLVDGVNQLADACGWLSELEVLQQQYSEVKSSVKS